MILFLASLALRSSAALPHEQSEKATTNTSELKSIFIIKQFWCLNNKPNILILSKSRTSGLRNLRFNNRKAPE